jgi:GNAT superfamily N-acetyltransferase
VNLATAGGDVRARLGTWPHERDVGHLMLADHTMVPADADVRHWIAAAAERGVRTLRTGALFPESVDAFLNAGFRTVDLLALLVCDPRTPPPHPPVHHVRTRRLTGRDLDAAAEVDQRAFHRRWSNSAASLGDIRGATPQHRSRKVTARGELVAFAISGRAGRCGYLQRLAVEPATQRRGYGTALVLDSLSWMRRHRVTSAMVNTAADNEAAIELYEALGFTRRHGDLQVLELTLEP